MPAETGRTLPVFSCMAVRMLAGSVGVQISGCNELLEDVMKDPACVQIEVRDCPATGWTRLTALPFDPPPTLLTVACTAGGSSAEGTEKW